MNRLIVLTALSALIVGLAAAPVAAQDAAAAYPMADRGFVSPDLKTGFLFEIFDAGDADTAAAFATVLTAAVGTDAIAEFKDLKPHALIANLGDGDGAPLFVGPSTDTSGKRYLAALLIVRDGQYLNVWAVERGDGAAPDSAALVKLAKTWFSPTHPRAETGDLLDRLPTAKDMPKGFVKIQEQTPTPQS